MAGIYGVLAYAVARRTAEIGVRVALGATPRNILRLIVGQGMRPILLGIAAGLAGAFWLSRFVSGLLFGIEAADLLTFAGVAAIVTLTALAACCVPALRALRINPVTALREE
jgi:ABC-type antimicrobial peptide transport system permease subunit